MVAGNANNPDCASSWVIALTFDQPQIFAVFRQVSVFADGSRAFTNSLQAIAEITLDESSCESAPWSFGSYLGLVHAVLAADTAVYVAGDSPFAEEVVQYTLDGRATLKMGNRHQSDAPDSLVYVTALSVCSAGLCVLDANSKKLVVFGPDGLAVGWVNLSLLLRGVEFIPLGLIVSSPTRAYLSVAVKGREDTQYTSEIYRIQGL